MMSKKIIFPALILLFLNGCYFFTEEEFLSLQKKQTEELKKVQTENSDLKLENQKLKDELKAIKVDKDKFMAALEIAKKDANHREIIRITKKIEDNFPGTKEALIATKLKNDALKIYEIQFKNATRDLKLKKNHKTETKWYYDSLEEVNLATAPLFLFIEEKKNAKPILKLRIQTTENPANSTKAFTLVSENDKYKLTPEKEDIKQKQISGGIWIWNDKEISNKEMTMLKDIIYSKQSSIRFEKTQNYEELPLSTKTKRSMIRVINGYLAMHNILKIKENL